MAREWSLQTVAGLKFRELEKTLIEVFGCIPVNFRRVVHLDVRKGKPLVKSETDLGSMEKKIVDIFGCMPNNKKVIEIDATRGGRKIIVSIVRDEGDLYHRGAHCA